LSSNHPAQYGGHGGVISVNRFNRCCFGAGAASSAIINE
jgi:hypothetical protein